MARAEINADRMLSGAASVVHALRTESVEQVAVRLLTRAVRVYPRLLLRLLADAFSPRQTLRQLVIAFSVQFLATIVRSTYSFVLRSLPRNGPDDAEWIWRHRQRERARTYAEWASADEAMSRVVWSGRASSSTAAEEAVWDQLAGRGRNYERLRADGDLYGLMFHLRSELMRRQAGGAGYSRDSTTWLRQHSQAREKIAAYQAAVCSSLRWIADGPFDETGPDADLAMAPQRLAFINETRHAFGRTALLLSGGAAFGLKHLGVVKALFQHQLLPRIISGTSAGSIVSAIICVKSDKAPRYTPRSRVPPLASPHRCLPQELTQVLYHGGIVAVLKDATFFTMRAMSASASASALGENSPNSPKRVREKTLLDGHVLRKTLLEIMGDITFLEAFDRTGRILNIVVTRSDGKAQPLLCNYLTTPNLLVYSASLASCAIPGVFEAVELLAKVSCSVGPAEVHL